MTDKDKTGGSVSHLFAFMKEVYSPALHAAYAIFWFLALDGFLAASLHGIRAWRFDWRMIPAVAAMFIVLFYLRVVDEIKDFDYDRFHNPDRPLVTGAVTRKDLARYLALSAALAMAASGMIHWLAAVIVAADLLYGIFLVWLEKKSALVRNNMFVNLVVTYPVNIALSLFVYVIFVERHIMSFSCHGLAVVAIFIAAFLHYEIGRKTCWPHQADGGFRHYSSLIGGGGSAALAALVALVAVGGAIWMLSPWRASGASSIAGWLMAAPLAPAAAGLALFFRARGRKEKPKPLAVMTPWAMGFLFLYYIALIANALARCAVRLAG